MISFYADENVDGRIIDGLRRLGVNTLTAIEVPLTGRISDEKHLEFAVERKWVLLTADTDLIEIARRWSASGRVHSGVIYYHPAWTTVGHVVNEVHSIAHALEPEALLGRVIFVSWDRRPRR